MKILPVGPETSSVAPIDRLRPSTRVFLSERCINPIVLLAFALNVVLVFSDFFPNLKDITGFGEAGYINNGKRLVEGGLTPFGYSPLSSILYAATYLPVQDSPYWLIYSCTGGRLLLFGLLWTSAYLVAKSQSRLASPYVMIVFLLVSPALMQLIGHGSHALFAAMSAFALWQVLLFYESKHTRHLMAASVFVGLAVLARSGEGLILFSVLVLFSVFFERRLKTGTTSLRASLLPFAAIVVGYILAYRIVAGSFDLGMAEYSYFTFEQGHGLAHQTEYNEKEDFYVVGQMEARRLFGTPEENHYSIATAIRRNPQAYLERVPRLIGLIPQTVIVMYAGLGVVFFLIAARGILELIKRRVYGLVSILLLWCSYTLVYPLLVFQPRHFLLPYYVVFLLASVGLTAIVDNFKSEKERHLWALVLLGILVAALVNGRARTFATDWIALLGFAITWIVMLRYRTVQSIRTIGMMLALIPFLMFAQYSEPRFRKIGVAADERATLYMREHLKSGAPVGAYAPINVWTANLTYIPMFRSALPNFQTEEDFSTWMKDNHLHAIYVDSYLKVEEPAVWELVQNQIGRELTIGFVSEKGDIEVLLAASNYTVDLEGYVERPWYSSKPRFVTPAVSNHHG